MLRAAGLTPLEERAYRLLLDRPAVDEALLALELELDAVAVRTLVRGLTERGLVSQAAGQTRLLPAPPDVAIEVLVRQREQELQQTRLLATELATRYREATESRTRTDLVEVVTGSDAISQRFEQLQRSARDEVLGLVRPPYATERDINTTELELLALGVHYRGIYDRTALEVPGAVEQARALTDAGEAARVAPFVPIKLAVADRELALVPLAAHQSRLDAGAILIHTCALLDALIALFEHLWERAVPFDLEGGATAGQLSPDEAALLSLLLSGLPDAAVARRLGVSERTVQRRVSTLMDRAGADSRMQLGYEAARRGWLTSA